MGIVGGGLIGALEACLLAQRGFKVTLFEARHDGRNEPSFYGRSINLAISHRGISALKRLNLNHIVPDRGIPMRARMIHNPNGGLKPIPYDPDGRCIYSIERAGLNNFLLDQAEQKYHVNIKFNHKLVDMNAEAGELVFRLKDSNGDSSAASSDNQDHDKLSDQLFSYRFDLICGCDGARSSVRSLLSRQTPLELNQTFIEHGYLELRIDPNEDGSFKMEPNYLHIWPRGQYMMIALPNKDNSFTCTLFMPYDILSTLSEPEQAIKFFETNFPDSIPLIGAQRIKDTLSRIRPSALISIKCQPYYYKDKIVLLGDSAHAMVPFYGQGMNCGFEDCLVLDELLDKYVGKATVTSGDMASIGGFDLEGLGQVLEEYSIKRCPNGQAMCDLAMYNYVEMRDLVNNFSFRLRKRLDDCLYRLFPNKWIPLYTMVTFTRTPIHDCVAKRADQDRLLQTCWSLTKTITIGAALGAFICTRLKNPLHNH